MTRLNIPLFVALAASILSAVPAYAGRDTLPHQRMIRKRTPPIIGRVEAFDHGIYVRQADPTGSLSTGAGSSAASSTATSASRATSASASATATSASESATSAASSTVASTSSGGLLDSLTNLLSTSSTVASTSATSTAISTSTAASSTTPQTSSTPSSTPQAPATSNTVTPSLNLASAAPSTDRAGSTLIVTQTAISPEASASASAAAKKKTQTITRNTIISLVVIASCIGGAIAIWTVIRKWKLSPSERFDDRMQPIDWAPQPAGAAADETIEEKRHRRAGSTGSHGSFTSGGVGKSETGHGAYNDSQHGHGYGMQSQDFPPAHDFTAGAAQPGYGQYYGGQQYAGGVPGYADLQRGPSMSESTYSHGASVTRGLSYSRGPTAGYEAQPGAAGVPPLPNPYGGEYGYDDYGHTGQPAGQPQQPQGQGQYRGY